MEQVKCRRTSRLAVAVLLLASGAVGAFGAPPSADHKIDGVLIRALADDEAATAPFFVVFGERPNLAAALSMRDRAARRRMVVQALQVTADRSQNGVRGYLRGQGVAFTAFWVENKIYVARGTLELARALAQRPEVVALLPERVHRVPPPVISGGTGVLGLEWNISRIGADLVWSAYAKKGEGLVVANIDTGVQYDHTALVNQYRGKTTSGFTHPGSWKDPTGTCTAAPCDNHGHGTHTMGTMVGDDGLSNHIGVAPGAKWIACKGCTNASCYESHLITCAQWIMDPYGGGSGAGQPDAVNNSWGGGSGNSWYQSYVQNWRAAGIFPAFSAGNTGPACGTAGSPGDYPESFASGATDSVDKIASFSARGPSAFAGRLKPNLSAPGVSIRSSVPANSYNYFSGTSMASPHTAGAVALLWSARPGHLAQIASTEQLLQDTALKIGTTETCGGIPAGSIPNNTYGYGRLDVKRAVDQAGTAPVNQAPTVTINSPLNGATFTCPVTVSFTATATDPEDGALTPAWTDNGASFGSGSTVSTYYACTAAGNHNIVASATDSKGASDTASITIGIVDSGVPAAPSSLAAQSNSPTITLTWADNSTETHFRLERKYKAGSTWTAWATVAASIPQNYTGWTDTVPAKGQYQYRLFAVNGTAESAPSNTASVRVK